jgi:PPM family protein phosphatase
MLRVVEQYSGTDTGRQRRANEDALLARPPLFVVADGMGGAQAGEVASRIAVEAFQTGLDGSDARGALIGHAETANARIHDLSQKDAEHAGMGTTLTALYVGGDEVTIAQVGDSRAYCLRDRELERLTDDHSLVDELIRQGKLTPEEAIEHPQRSIITRALGPEASVEVDTRTFRARRGDIYLLCSDGLTTMVAEEELLRTLLAHRHLHDAGEALIAAANAAGGRDNITVILLRLDEVEPAADSLAEAATMIGVPAVGPLEAQPAHGAARPQPGATAEWSGLPLAAGTDAVGAGASDADRAPGRAARLRGRRATQAAAAATRQRPRYPGAREARTRRPRRHRLRLGAWLAVLTVLGVLGAGAYLATQAVYFIGTNEMGLVTVFNGLPYELPGGLKLYTKDFVSGVSASTLSTARRQTLINNSLRSESDAMELVRQLELGRLGGE